MALGGGASFGFSSAFAGAAQTSATPCATTISGYATCNPLDPNTPEIFDARSGLTIVPPPSQCAVTTTNQFAVAMPQTTDGWARGHDAVTQAIEYYVVYTCDPSFANDVN